LIPPSFLTLAFYNVLEYRHVCFNRENDASTSYKNLVNFGSVALGMTGFIYVLLYLHWAKIGLSTFICWMAEIFDGRIKTVVINLYLA